MISMILSLRELIFDGKDACSVFANYNNSRQTSLSIDAEGQSADGTLLWGVW